MDVHPTRETEKKLKDLSAQSGRGTDDLVEDAKGESPAGRAILDFMRPVDAFYENGLLRPVSPLPLRSGERVAVIVVRRPDPRRWDVDRLAAHGDDDLALAEAGLDDWAAALDREDRA
jgi:Protein of unknown function DUF104